MNNDLRNLSKWLNEEQETPIDRQALARVLAMAQQEPVAWEYCEEIYDKSDPALNDYIRANGIPLYTTPPAQRKPLTDEQINKAAEDEDNETAFLVGFYAGARFAEAAHGITGETQ